MQLALGDRRCGWLCAKRGGGQLRSGGIGTRGDQRHRVHRRAKHVGDRLGQRGCTLDPRSVTEPPPQRLGIAAGHELCRNEQRNNPTWARELEGALGEGNGNIGEMCETARSRRTPARVARRERFAHPR